MCKDYQVKIKWFFKPKLKTKNFCRIGSLLLLLASGEVEEARGGGEAKYGGDRETVWMLEQSKKVLEKVNYRVIYTIRHTFQFQFQSCAHYSGGKKVDI